MGEPEASKWYEDFFLQDYHRLYVGGALMTPERTLQEVSFLEEVLALWPGAKVLDLACGWGRHAIPLAQRGYQVTGQDLSQFHLDLARREAERAGLSLSLVRSDMREIPFTGEFDAVINMFSAFGYLENDEEDAKVLQQVAKALRPAGQFLIDFGNREYVVRNYAPHDWQRLEDGLVVLQDRRLDLLTSRNHVRMTLIEPDGSHRETGHRFRFYTLTEQVKMLAAAGLTLQKVWGGFDGSEYSLDSRRMIVLALKE